MKEITRRQIQALLRETESCCIYCGRLLTKETASRDHIRPYCHGGTDTMENFVVSCKRCNVKKDSMPVSAFVSSQGHEFSKAFRQRVKKLMEAGKMPEFKGEILLESGKERKQNKADFKVSRFTIRRIASETSSTCIYCGKLVDRQSMEIDLILDPSLGGKKTRDNMVLCCETCKAKKRQLGASEFRAAMGHEKEKKFRHRVHQLALAGHISAKKARALLPHSKDLFDLCHCWKFRIGRLKITFRWDKR